MDDGDDSEWNEVPEDVVALIHARLPLVSLVRSRAVCKKWNAAVASPELLKERLESREGLPDCLLLVVGWLPDSTIASCIYDRAPDQWYHLRLSPGLRPVAASGGVLLSAMYQGPKEVGQQVQVIPHIGNPMARSWTRLEPLPDGLCAQDVVGVFVDAKAGCFKLVVVSRVELTKGGGDVPTYVFDSTRWGWRCTTLVFPRGQFFSNAYEGAVVGSFLFCAGKEGNLLAFHMEWGTWMVVTVTRPGELMSLNCNLINVRGWLVCVACWETRERGPCLQIWRMDFKRMAWTVVDTMPAPMFTEFCNSRLFHRVKGMKVVATQDCQLYIMDNELDKIAVFDFRRTPAAWRWLPPCPYDNFVSKSPHCLDPWVKPGSWTRKQV